MAKMMDRTEETRIIYVTKWWQAQGIKKVEARVLTYENGTHMAVWGHWGTAAHDGQFSLTYEEACDRVEELARRKMVAMNKQLTKLATLRATAEAHKLEVHEIGAVEVDIELKERLED